MCSFGCCDDGLTSKANPKGRGCPKVPCAETKYGCCPDKKGIAKGPNFKDCKEMDFKNCTANFFGCCLDGKTSCETIYINFNCVVTLITFELLQRLGRTTRGARRCRPALPRSLVAVTTRSRPPTGQIRKAAVYRQSSGAALTTSRQLREST
jgi:hypothetical protein